jgi:hypothetical protein
MWLDLPREIVKLVSQQFQSLLKSSVLFCSLNFKIRRSFKLDDGEARTGRCHGAGLRSYRSVADAHWMREDDDAVLPELEDRGRKGLHRVLHPA